MSEEWALNAMFLIGTLAYVYILYRIFKLSRDVYRNRRWNAPQPSYPKMRIPSPRWKWAPWIVVVVWVLLFSALLLIGMEALDALAGPGILLIVGVKLAAMILALFE
ncbi:MAG: hypothetical protein ACKV0T_16520 [Planctomycetales bacterium]